MTTIVMTQERGRSMAQPARRASMVQRLLLACGVLSSLLYAATDVLGGMRYPGYSFTGQAISELAAIGAPSEAFVDPLFLAYDVLALLFAVGVFRYAPGRSRALRISGAVLIAYAAVGLSAAALAGPTFFKMQQRGAGSLATDAPHIILMSVVVLLLLLAIGSGAFALGRRFRSYSFATLVTVLVFGALTARFATRIAAGQPTPGLGIIERIDVYTPMLWLAVLAVALLRRPPSTEKRSLP
jgi:hypothetical protein